MEYKIGRSHQKDVKQAVAEATIGLSHPKLIIFSSGVEGFEDYSKELKACFNESIIMGITTYIGLCKEGTYKNELLVLGIEKGIECYADVLENVDKYPVKYISRIEKCIHSLSDCSNTVCFEFSTALISSEELILTTLNSVLENKKIPLFGGSSGDAGKAEKTMVSFNGVVYEKACVFALIKNLNGKIKLYRENIYKPTNHYFIATKVDVRNRIVYEYDHEPAAKVMAKALNTDISHLPNYLDQYPWGRIIGNEMYITANQAITKENGLAYHARVYKNSQMVLLEPDDYKQVIQKTAKQIHQDMPHPSLAIMVHCLARCILFESSNYLSTFAKEMGNTLGNYIGFSGYGEQLNQQHFNQTMVIAVFE